MKRLYFDYNATCPLQPAARKALQEILEATGPTLGGLGLGNPSSAHAEGRRARKLLESARERLAAALGAQRDEVVFTSGGSESNALALGVATEARPAFVAAHEHPSVLQQPCVKTLAVDTSGQVDFEAIHSAAVTPGIVSMAVANHETGNLGDLTALVDVAARAGALSHTDACQAVGRVPFSFAQLGVDVASVSAHKLGGPVGVGALLLREGTTLRPWLRGGGQEHGLRAGTEPALLAHMFAAAAEQAVSLVEQHARRYRRWSHELYSYIQSVDESCVLNSPATDGLPNTLNLSLLGRPGVSLVHRLDLEGVSISHGSACASGSLEASPVLLAMGWGDARASSSLRISFGPDTTDDDVRMLAERIRVVLENVSTRDDATGRRLDDEPSAKR